MSRGLYHCSKCRKHFYDAEATQMHIRDAHNGDAEVLRHPTKREMIFQHEQDTAEIARLRAEIKMLRAASQPKYGIGSVPDILPKVDQNRMILQPVRNSLSEGNNLTMQLAPLGWQPSSAHHALEAMVRELELSRAQVLSAYERAAQIAETYEIQSDDDYSVGWTFGRKSAAAAIRAQADTA